MSVAVKVSLKVVWRSNIGRFQLKDLDDKEGTTGTADAGASVRVFTSTCKSKLGLERAGVSP